MGSAGLRQDNTGPDVPEKLGPPVLFETLALYAYVIFENAKITKIRKLYFSFWIFDPEIDENEIHARTQEIWSSLCDWSFVLLCS